ncbi:hypothetical protein HanRHA438_Chr13g0584071 [Helianthus annuus]|nr:hypothetical protein HanIR_Chr13g0623931 [Helianthus annuus]KAJ0856921.1 hypothetical protein HanRHA438_Chr13g0584071 [Helianthus annuus]
MVMKLLVLPLLSPLCVTYAAEGGGCLDSAEGWKGTLHRPLPIPQIIGRTSPPSCASCTPVR